MTVSSGAYMKSLFAASLSLGDAAINSDATMEIEGNPKPAYTATIVFLYHFNK